jgi:putative molybdopterin biosynthesis protein
MNQSRNIYLKMKTLAEAREILFHHFGPGPLGSEPVADVTDAVGRVLARPVYARLSSPGFHGPSRAAACHPGDVSRA